MGVRKNVGEVRREYVGTAGIGGFKWERAERGKGVSGKRFLSGGHGGHRLNRLCSAHHERSDEAATRNRYISVRNRYISVRSRHKCERNGCLVRACVREGGRRAR